jgi:hypothetical protein
MFGEVEVKLHAVLIPTLDGDEWSRLCPNHFILTIITPRHLMGRRLGEPHGCHRYGSE